MVVNLRAVCLLGKDVREMSNVWLLEKTGRRCSGWLRCSSCPRGSTLSDLGMLTTRAGTYAMSYQSAASTRAWRRSGVVSAYSRSVTISIAALIVTVTNQDTGLVYPDTAFFSTYVKAQPAHRLQSLTAWENAGRRSLVRSTVRPSFHPPARAGSPGPRGLSEFFRCGSRSSRRCDRA